MNRWNRIILDVFAVIALLILVGVLYGLTVDPTSHQDIFSELERVNRNHIIICSELELACE